MLFGMQHDAGQLARPEALNVPMMPHQQAVTCLQVRANCWMTCHKKLISTAGLAQVRVSLELRANAPVDLLQSVRQLEAAKAEANFLGLLLPLQMELTSRDSVVSTA